MSFVVKGYSRKNLFFLANNFRDSLDFDSIDFVFVFFQFTKMDLISLRQQLLGTNRAELVKGSFSVGRKYIKINTKKNLGVLLS